MSLKSSVGVDSKTFEKQMRNWELSRAQHLEAPPEQRRKIHDFIALSQAIGTDGVELAEHLGAALHWPVFDRQILQAMAGDDEFRRRLYDSLDERDLGLFEETCRCLMDGDFHKNDYFHRLTEAVWEIALRGPAVFVGRGVDLILPRTRGLRVRVTAPLESRVRRFAAEQNMALVEARIEMERLQRERESWIRKHFHIDPMSPERFDLALNLQTFSPQAAAALIHAAMTGRVTSPGPAQDGARI